MRTRPPRSSGRHRTAGQDRLRRHRHRLRRSTARTSPASPPPTTCSAARWTARRPAPSSSRLAPAASAPAARSVALTDGMAELAANRGVDIINMSIGGLPALNDGNNARAGALQPDHRRRRPDRHLRRQQRQRAQHDRRPFRGHRRRQRRLRDLQRDVEGQLRLGRASGFVKNMLTYSSGGPREDGGFKPNVTAPGSAISTTPTWQPGGPVAEAGYALPAGYAMFNGTSMAVTADRRRDGAAASRPPRPSGVAKATGAAAPGRLQHGRLQRRGPGVPAGPGEVDVPAAWDLLRQTVTPQHVHGLGTGVHRDLEDPRSRHRGRASTTDAPPVRVATPSARSGTTPSR